MSRTDVENAHPEQEGFAPSDVGVDSGLPVLPRPGEEFGFTVARAAGLACVAVAVDRLLRLPSGTAWAIVVAVLVLALVPAAGARSASASAAVTWALADGFLTNRMGVLTFGPADRGHLAVLLAAGLAAVLLSRHVAATHRRGG